MFSLSFLRWNAPLLRQIRHYRSDVLDREVDIDVYLPPEYKLAPGKRYPLVVFNDGQDLPRMHFGDILKDLYHKKAIQPIIAVGVYTCHDRIREYGTARQADYKGRGDKAPLYRDFVLTELMPMLHKRFRLSGKREETVLAGFSLGGLSAFDIAWAHPDIFGKTGVFSGAFWWRWSDVDPANPDADRIMHDIIHNAPHKNEGQEFWFQCGTRDEEDDRNHNGIIDAIDDTLDIMRALKGKGHSDDDMRYLEIQDGEHNPDTWAVAMPDFLRWTQEK